MSSVTHGGFVLTQLMVIIRVPLPFIECLLCAVHMDECFLYSIVSIN